MPERSAGVLLYRRIPGGIELLLAHPGGPFWAKKDDGAWSIPKGLVEDGEDVESAARREFAEELGAHLDASLIPLGNFRQKSGKIVTAFAAEADFDPAALRSNTFDMEWPPRSGRQGTFPEVDRAAWFAPDVAVVKIVPGQAPAIAELLRKLTT